MFGYLRIGFTVCFFLSTCYGAAMRNSLSTTRSVPICRDIYDLGTCARLVEQGKCLNDNQMQFLCPLSCKFCVAPSGCRDKLETVVCNLFTRTGHCNSHSQMMFMREYCPLTCGFCGATTPLSCSDSLHPSTCEIYVKNGYCKDPKQKPQMLQACPSSCDLCEESRAVMTTPKTVVTTSSTCSDSYPQTLCRLYSSHGHCSNPSLFQVMKDNCALTCQFCSSMFTAEQVSTIRSVGSTAPMSTRDGNTTSFSGTTVNPCVDANTSKCAQFHAVGLCGKEDFRQLMMDNCPRTCGFCLEPKCTDTFNCSLNSLPEKLRCDGVKDCPSGFDESPCATMKTPVCTIPTEFNRAVVRSYKCRKSNGDVIVNYLCRSGEFRSRMCILETGKWNMEIPPC